VLRGRARLFSALALLTVVAVNTAGLWSIAASRRSAADQAAQLFAADVGARGRALETLVTGIRADLAFLADSAPLARVLAAAPGHAAPAQQAAREAAEAAALLFLRGHAEVTRLALIGARGEPLIVAGRRGGLPILWVASNPKGDEGPAVSPDVPRLAATVTIAGPNAREGGAGDASRLEAELAPSLLLRPVAAAAAARRAPGRACVLLDARRTPLARDQPAPAGDTFTAAAELNVAGWSAPSPWRLECEQSRQLAVAGLEPVAARYRATLALNLGAMGLAALLGLLAIREVRRRERLESRGREEARVREVERQLYHAERLSSLGRLTAGIAHEINNPLEGMANYLSLTRDALERRDVDAAKRRLDGIRQGLERAALVVRQALAHADPAKAPHEPVDLNHVLAEAIEFVRSRPEFAAIRFEAALAGQPLVVNGSAIMLGQIALNLLVNACEAQPAGGEIRVNTRRDGDRAVAEVADRGPGIAPAERERVFEPFFSTKNSTGLGLSICHSIARRHAGQLEALPREGGGTVFRLSLPATAVHTEVA
jgi:signal transduction histidine kinase